MARRRALRPPRAPRISRHRLRHPFIDSDSATNPGNLSGLALFAFLFVWFVFWTFGGVTAIGLTLRLVFGHDTIEIAPGGFLVRQSIGPLERAIEFRRPALTEVRVNRARGEIIAIVGGKTRKVSDFGTPEERRRAVDWIRQTTGLPPRPERVAAFPPDWVESRAVDGSTVFTNRWGGSGSCLAGCAILGLACLGFAAVPLLVLGAERGAAHIFWAVTGLVVLLATFLLRTATDEWRIARGKLDIARTTGVWSWTKEVRNATLHVKHTLDDDRDEVTTLYANTPDKEHRLLTRTNEGRELAAIARRVAEITGWKLTIDPDVEPE